MPADPLSTTFAALADPTRRAILARLTRGDATVNELAEPFDVTLQAVSKHLKVLERAGLVTREPDAEDRRTVTVTLTDRGREWASAARPAYDDAATRLAAGLPDDSRARFAEYLAAWQGFFEPDDGEAPRLGIAVAPAATASRMRRAVGLPDRHGVLVLKVRRDSAADKAGLERGDLVTGAAGAEIRTIGDLHRAVRKAGATLVLDVVRGVDERAVEVALKSAA